MTIIEGSSLYLQLVEASVLTIEGVGVLIILLGTLLGAWDVIRSLYIRRSFDLVYRRFHQRLGYSILLGMDFLLAGDIIHSIAVDATMDHVLILSLIVLVRAILGFTLRTELEGKLPWEQIRTTGSSDNTSSNK